MHITVVSPLGTRMQDAVSSDLASLAIRPEGFPYSVHFQVDLPIDGFPQTLVLDKAFTGPNDAPLEARIPVPLWRMRVTNPEGLDADFAPTFTGLETRPLAPYQATNGESSAHYGLPAFHVSADDGPGAFQELVFIAPHADTVPGMLGFVEVFGEEKPPSLPASLTGSGVYEFHKDGLRLVSRTFPR